ncbi:hypothetical protein G7050_05140 [Dysgonomonas sp. HDW5A]|uniref:hypothetical protein n=1 Tax=Dysgonomonas sp. HDW5A TaxID=2714926 RepID=UPI00140DE71F|nr:hypothetical protein [Dysgonomonas sp. HDW5A]QIK59255.1 hypothetical protein G7050_05140 [Dysgonomonas sp. HDW5A]
MDSKAKTKEKRLSLISFCFLTLSFALRVPRAIGKVGSLTDYKLLHASAEVHQWHSRWLQALVRQASHAAQSLFDSFCGLGQKEYKQSVIARRKMN